MTEVKAPFRYLDVEGPVIFMAGSIEMGTAEPWRHKVVKRLEGMEIMILNPRRDDWDSSWVQSINHKEFYTQVSWELLGIEDADLNIVYFDPKTNSPITLLELGLMAGMETPTIVCCPDGFYRQGNVEIVCERYAIPFHRYFTDFLDAIEEFAQELTGGN